MQLDGQNSSFSSEYSSNFPSDISDDELSSSMSSSFEEDYGNNSFTSSYLQYKQYPIPVVVNIFKNNVHTFPAPSWYEPTVRHYKSRSPVRKTIKRDNRIAKSVHLPVLAVSNLCLLMPKLNNFIEDMHQREVGVALLSEVWQKAEKRNISFKLTECFTWKV